MLFIDFKGKGPPAMGGFFYGQKWGVGSGEFFATNARILEIPIFEIPNSKLRAHFSAIKIIHISSIRVPKKCSPRMNEL